MQMDRMITIGTLAASVGHEINNPLAYVITNLEYCLESFEGLEDEHDVRAEFKDALTEAHDGASRVKRVLGDLRTLSRTAAPQPRPSNVTEVVESAIRMAGAQLREKAFIERDMVDVDPVLVDGGRLGQVVLNLLVNAAQAIDGDDPNIERVLVSVRQRGDRVRLTVADSGSGIPDELLSRIFEPFFTTKPIGEGTGLGLAICREIVAEAGGSISVSTEVGQGTRFTLDLPVDSSGA